jgi:hypothetical protein
MHTSEEQKYWSLASFDNHYLVFFSIGRYMGA